MIYFNDVLYGFGHLSNKLEVFFFITRSFHLGRISMALNCALFPGLKIIKLSS